MGFVSTTLIVGLISLIPSYSFAKVYSCEGKAGETRPEAVYPDNLELDTSVKDSMGGPLIRGKQVIFMHLIGKTVRQTTIFTKNGKAKVQALAYRTNRWYQCSELKGAKTAKTRESAPETKSPKLTKPKTSKLNKAKSTCTDLGFTAGTEKHGECVLKMMDQKLSEANTKTPTQNVNPTEYEITEDAALFKATVRGFQHSHD